MRYIDSYDAILLDLCDTFMFGVDRFGPSEDYDATYRTLGGRSLSAEQVTSLVDDLLDTITTAYADPLRHDDFGDVARFMSMTPTAASLPDHEQALLIELIARHEVGKVSESHASALHRLAATHLLGLVSNIWSAPRVFEASLTQAGVLDLFAVTVWSSTTLSIKPSPLLFTHALETLGVSAERVLFVGDDPVRDVAGSKGVGMGTVWIRNRRRPLDPTMVSPDRVIDDLLELVSLPA